MIGKSGRGCVSGKALVRLRWLWAPGEVFSKREQARGVGAEAQRPESDAPLVVRCFLERHIFAGEHGAQEDPVVPPAEVAPSLHAAQFGGGGVLENGQPPRKRSGRGRVVARGGVLASASCGRRWLNVCRHWSKRCCCAPREALAGRV